MITPEQLTLIEQQLGRAPRGIREIAYQSPDGIPMVLRMDSLIDEKPFPTLYWLCSKDLYKAISQIETSGWIKQIEQELLLDEALKARYLTNHAAYVAQRNRLMSDEIRQRISELGFTDLFRQYGIGGISQWDKVRCLHMQYAHYLANQVANQASNGEEPGTRDSLSNVIGERMEQEFGLSQIRIRL